MKQTMLKSLQVMLMAVLLLLTMVGRPAIAQTSPELTYGKEYYLPNLWNGDGGYLDTNGRGCEGNDLCVSTSHAPDERGYNTSTWTMVSATGKQVDTPVLYNEKVYLQNGFNGSYLDTNSRGCEGNDLCVSTSRGANERGYNTSTWTILSASGKQSGTPVLSNDEIYLQNVYDNSYLDTRGAGCENNYLCVSTSSTKERDPKTTHWRIVYKKPPVAITPPGELKPGFPEPPVTVNPCDPNKPIPGAFSTIRIGDFDGFGFKDGTGLKSTSGSAINLDGNGILSTKDYLPDFNGDNKISNRDAGDPFDNRSDAEVAGTLLTGDGFEDMGSKGSDYTDLSLGKAFGYKTSSTYGHSFPDGDPNTLPNTPSFQFRFKVAKDKLPQGTPLFFNVIFGDYDVEPVVVILKNSQGKTVRQELTASAKGENDGIIQSAFGTLDFSQVFADGDTSGETGYWVGSLDVDFDAPTEPYLSFDFAEIGTQQIPLTSCPQS
ncbi:hypothetical protein [Crocosphaera sp. XPORK-15E]|uniref:hypothetical protein n=1 Tax=Crocosphaera sp. XPORK-15E TaxID=3110247 RepID=UPI002B204FD6|nr:hypothetical protein [Crocosphaera sp. XPORK-15E]MEA5532391.1 hypothetical protein [Crocosphaera sp. XPORK-15E]